MIVCREIVLVESRSLFLLLFAFWATWSSAKDLVSNDDQVYLRIKIDDRLTYLAPEIHKSVLSLMLFKKKIRTILLADGEKIKVDPLVKDGKRYFLLRVRVSPGADGLSFQISLLDELKSRLLKSIKKDKINEKRLIYYLSKALRLVLYN